MRTALIIAAACISALTLQAQIWEFDLGGQAGPGLLGGNETNPNLHPSSASGDELNKNFPGTFPSISYNEQTRELRLPIGWGSKNSIEGGAQYNDLTAEQTVWHIHGPVASNPGDDLTDYFTRNASPLPYSYETPIDQTGDGSQRSASFDTTIVLTDLDIGGTPYTVDQQFADLIAGRWYINVHSAGDYSGGEIRGQLIAVPEPEHYAAFAGVALLGFAGYRKFTKSEKPA